VHGSLARAGKVRGQTPKVAKQDKKKQPKGRAMKRIKYNRRFVNVGMWAHIYFVLFPGLQEKVFLDFPLWQAVEETSTTKL
jgi:small subunit ribosomal protein S30e